MTDTRAVPFTRLTALEGVTHHAGIANLEAVQGDGGWWVPDLTFLEMRRALAEFYAVERALRDERRQAEREQAAQGRLVA